MGWLVNNKEHFGRVCDISQYTDGAPLVIDDANGVIYRVAYTAGADIVGSEVKNESKADLFLPFSPPRLSLVEHKAVFLAGASHVGQRVEVSRREGAFADEQHVFINFSV